MKKVIYVYSDGVPNQYKIGKADQRVDQDDSISLLEIAQIRISEQVTAATRGTIDILQVFEVSHYPGESTAVEHFIHTELSVRGNIDRLKRTVVTNGRILKEGDTEWFETALEPVQLLEEVDNLIIKFTKQTGKPKYTPRVYQEVIKAQVLDQVDEGHQVIAAELAPRFGKTLWALDLFNSLSEEFGYKYLILPSYVLTAHTSFQNDSKKFSDFNGIDFISDRDPDFEEKVKQSSRAIISVSLHANEETHGKFDVINQIEKELKVSIIDEADFGAHTKHCKKIIDLIDSNLTILITGTAIERAVMGYSISEVIRWSYTDMLLFQDGTHPILDNFCK